MRALSPCLIAAVCCAAFLGTSIPALTARAADSDEAEKHYRNGLALRAQRQDDQALQAFRSSYALSKAPRALAQIAFAEQALGRWVDAEVHLTEAMGAAADPWIIKNRPTLDSSLGYIQDRLATVELAGGVGGAEVRVNGKLAGAMPLSRPIRVVAGTIALDVRAPGYFPMVRTLNVPARGLARETIDLVPAVTGGAAGGGPVALDPTAGRSHPSGLAGGTPPPPAPDGGSRSSKQALAGWVALGAAGVALATGVTFQLIRESRISKFNANEVCEVVDGNVVGGSDCESQYAGADSAQTKAIIGFVAAGVLGVTSAILLYTAPRAADRHVAGLRLQGCGQGPGRLGLACVVTF
jgi:hypothetical protein